MTIEDCSKIALTMFGFVWIIEDYGVLRTMQRMRDEVDLSNRNKSIFLFFYQCMLQWRVLPVELIRWEQLYLVPSLQWMC